MPYEDPIFEKLKTEKPPLNMPNVKKLINSGACFYRCVTPSPLCAPARACLASGLRFSDCPVPDNDVDYPTDTESFYRVLRDSGYSVGGVGKFDLHKATYFWGFDGWVDGLGKIGFTSAVDSEGKWDAIGAYNMTPTGPKGPYMKYLRDKGLDGDHISDMGRRREGGKYYTEPTTLPDSAYGDTWVGTNGIKMLKSFPKDKPWFLQVNFPGPHAPWDVTQSMRKRWENISFPAAGNGDASKAADLNRVRQNYAAMLENIDTQTGLLLDEIRRRGDWDNTIIIYSSDHGEMLGDWGRFGKSCPDRGSINVPLVFAGPGIRENICTGALAEITDLSATILDFAGISNRFHEAYSMKKVLTGEAASYRRTVQSALSNWKAIIGKKYKIIIQNSEVTEKYNVLEDPLERENLIR